MDRDAKHALFAAAALNAILVVEMAKDPEDRIPTKEIVGEADWYASQLIHEVEKK